VFGDPVHFIARLPALLVGLVFHEYAHARAANFCGDPTAKYAGRLTLNPLPHLDLMGTICLLFSGFIGWAKPVPVNPAYYRKPWAEYLVSLAGVGTNLALAIAAGILIRVLNVLNVPLVDYVWLMLAYMVIINIALMLFNLLPIAPLDGSHVMMELLPYRYKERYANFNRYGPILILVLAMSGAASGVIFGPMRVLVHIITGMPLLG